VQTGVFESSLSNKKKVSSTVRAELPVPLTLPWPALNSEKPTHRLPSAQLLITDIDLRPKMLTGVEIAGFLLAVLPLFIAAAKPYREGLDTMKTALRSKVMDEKLEDFYRELEFEVTLLKYTLEGLIQSLPIITEAEKDRFVESFDTSLLDNGELTRAFNERLGRAFDTFESHLRHILRLLEKVVDDDTLQNTPNKMVNIYKI